MIINPDEYKNTPVKEKNDLIAEYMAKIIELHADELDEFKNKSQVALYFNDALGKPLFKVKVAYHITDFRKLT